MSQYSRDELIENLPWPNGWYGMNDEEFESVMASIFEATHGGIDDPKGQNYREELMDIMRDNMAQEYENELRDAADQILAAGYRKAGGAA